MPPAPDVAAPAGKAAFGTVFLPVSYTHLDVYKRQLECLPDLLLLLLGQHGFFGVKYAGGAAIRLMDGIINPGVQMCIRDRISPRFVSAIENDRRKPSLDVLIRLVHAIGASFDEVLAPPSIPEDYTTDRRCV